MKVEVPVLLEELGPDTKYIFVTHHKTGTHLMWRLCSAAAWIVTNGTEECHWCFRPVGLWGNGTLRCPTNNNNKFGKSTGGRFTMVSATDGWAWRNYVLKWAKSHRVVHAVREPKDMIISDLQYNQRLMRRNQTLWDCDQNVSVWLDLTLKEQIQNISYAMSHCVDQMCMTSQVMRKDENATAIKLEEFEEDFPRTSRRMFRFLFGNHSRMEWLMSEASKLDLKAHPKLVVNDMLAVSNHSKRPKILEAVNELVQENNRWVKGAASCEGAKEARSWNRIEMMKKPAREAVEKMLMVSERFDGYWEV